ncbi:MAG: aldolase/citrate lyase family protein [Candidatus Omnitrophota bacterium]
MYKSEKALFAQLLNLKKNYGLKGIKAEFEAEGSSFRDIVRLRRMTAKAGVGLFLKIGGVESVKDIKDSVDLGVDGIIAPMVETKFGVKKFMQAFGSIYKDERVHLAINIETKNAVNQIDEILEYASGRIDSITIGRTDLCASYFHKNVVPDSEFIMNVLEMVGEKTRRYGMGAAIGGSLGKTSINIFKKNRRILGLFDRMETRKVILPSSVMVGNKKAINEALRFEELYILSKKEINDVFLESEIARLTQLERRL